jgi:4-amino-4-deoxychorismate lyase
MSRYFETIRVEHGTPQHLSYHEKRIFQTIGKHVDLAPMIKPPSDELLRCKVIYDQAIQTITYTPYQPKDLKKFLLVDIDFDYNKKYLDRDNFKRLLAQHPKYDDVIMVKDGLITDTTIANTAFYMDHIWVTPKKPLLEGTARARLLDNQQLAFADLSKNDIQNTGRFAIINAMVGFKEIKGAIIDEYN